MVLVDMEMPTTCMTCKIQGSCTKHLGWSNHKKSIQKSDKCPIKCELPEVYGPLIDADELKKSIGHTGYCYDIQNLIDEADVIVPAEEVKE